MAVVLLLFVGAKFFTGGSYEELKMSFTGSNTDGIVTIAPDADEDARINAILDGTSATGEVRDLIIQDLEEGEGKEVEEGDLVTVHYIGTLPNGMEFDNSFLAGQPFMFTVGVGDVIEGWDTGILGMKPGGQRILIVPPELAYGDRSVGRVPADATLVFAIELVDVQ